MSTGEETRPDESQQDELSGAPIGVPFSPEEIENVTAAPMGDAELEEIDAAEIDERTPDLESSFDKLVQKSRRLSPERIRTVLESVLFVADRPLTVQELVNTFAFAIQPITIVTLSIIILASLLFVGAFKAFQVYAEEILQRRLFARVALGMTQLFPDVRISGFKPRYANYFTEAVFMQRALSGLLIDRDQRARAHGVDHVGAAVVGHVGHAVFDGHHGEEGKIRRHQRAEVALQLGARDRPQQRFLGQRRHAAAVGIP